MLLKEDSTAHVIPQGLCKLTPFKISEKLVIPFLTKLQASQKIAVLLKMMPWAKI